jgi:hypothetical protein
MSIGFETTTTPAADSPIRRRVRATGTLLSVDIILLVPNLQLGNRASDLSRIWETELPQGACPSRAWARDAKQERPSRTSGFRA